MLVMYRQLLCSKQHQSFQYSSPSLQLQWWCRFERSLMKITYLITSTHLMPWKLVKAYRLNITDGTEGFFFLILQFFFLCIKFSFYWRSSQIFKEIAQAVVFPLISCNEWKLLMPFPDHLFSFECLEKLRGK